MNPFIALVQKDLKLYFSDRRAVILTFAVPIMIASFFGSLFGGKSGQSQRGRMALQATDLDQSSISRQIISNLVADENLNVTINSETEARHLVQLGKAPVALIIPKGFGDAASRTFFGQGSKPEITIAHDPSRSMEVGMAKGLLTQHVMETVSKEMFGGKAGSKYVRESLDQLRSAPGLASDDRTTLVDMLSGVEKWMDRSQTSTNEQLRSAGPGISMPFVARDEAVTQEKSKSEYNGYAHSFAGMAVQFILMAAIELGVGILLERQRGLWKRLRAAPLSRQVLLSSKATSIAIISTLTMTVCFTFAWLVFGVVVQGSFLGFVLCIVAFSLFAASVGLLLASFGLTPAATRGLAIPFVLIMVMLGGAWVPAFVFPQWLQKLTLIMPTRWAVDGLDAMTWRGLGWQGIWLPLVVLLGFALVCGGLALARFRWEAE